MTTSFRPGQIDIQELTLIPPSGNILNIKGMFVEMSIYENIFSNNVSGVITLVDTHNIVSELPLLGEEYISFKYKVLDSDEPLQVIFRTYKVGEKEIQGNKQIYKLHFTSLEMYLDATHGFSRTLTGHAETIISQLLFNELNSGKSFTYDSSGNFLKVTSPFWTPFKCIGWATQKAVSPSKERNSDFLFYETLSGYKFRNMSLAKQSASKATFFHNHDRAVDDDFTRQYGKEMNQVKDFYVPLVVDQLDRFRHELYKTQVISHDITFKALNTYNFDLFERWGNQAHLNTHPHYTSQLSPFVTAAVKTSNEAAYSHNDKQYDWNGLVTSQRKPAIMLNEMIKVDIEIWGRMGLEPGDVVDLSIGKLTQADTQSEDDYYSGRYMLGAIHHRIAPNEYRMYVQLIKDSVGASLK